MLKLSILVFVVLAILKLTELIAWSWWWISSPLLIGGVLWLMLAIGVVVGGMAVANKVESRKRLF